MDMDMDTSTTPNNTGGQSSSQAQQHSKGNIGADDIRYFPNFLKENEEEYLMDRIYSAPKPKWHNLSNRRLQNWGGAVGNQCLMQTEELPKWLNLFINKITSVPSGFPPERRPNHVLINEYSPGQGIMPHTDGSAFFPLISTISLGSHTFLNFYEEKHQQEEENREYIGSLLLEPRSLVLISGRAYQLLHGIEERHIDSLDEIGSILNWEQLGQKPTAGTRLERKTRISLTIRNVPRVKKIFI